MSSFGANRWKGILAVLAGVLILKVTVSIVLGYRDYFPPNFQAEFLSGRQSYFAGPYQWAFYPHIAAGPVSLVLGLILISEQFRKRFPRWHRLLGKIQGLLTLGVLVPSGLWIAFYSRTGPVAAAGFASLAVATGVCVLMGWRLAVKKRFGEHRLWMWRCFLLLCSAVVLRLMGGLATVTGIIDEWPYPFAAWASWLIPLAIFELSTGLKRRRARVRISAEDQSSPSRATLSSLPAMVINARN